MTRYHWFVFVVAALGWLFDCLDQQLFVLARPAAMKELLPPLDDPQAFAELVKIYGNYATSIFLAGWAIGGLLFGVLGDRIGRAKTMVLTILLYSVCTGLSALSKGFWDFALYRFLTGLGVGGEFAVGVALVAEVMPVRARPHTLALLQALSSVGNVAAALINMGLGVAESEGLGQQPVADHVRRRGLAGAAGAGDPPPAEGAGPLATRVARGRGGPPTGLLRGPVSAPDVAAARAGRIGAGLRRRDRTLGGGVLYAGLDAGRPAAGRGPASV